MPSFDIGDTVKINFGFRKGETGKVSLVLYHDRPTPAYRVEFTGEHGFYYADEMELVSDL